MVNKRKQNLKRSPHEEFGRMALELSLLKDNNFIIRMLYNLEVDCHNTPLISQCKLDSVLPVILIEFYVTLCYYSRSTNGHQQYEDK